MTEDKSLFLNQFLASTKVNLVAVFIYDLSMLILGKGTSRSSLAFDLNIQHLFDFRFNQSQFGSEDLNFQSTERFDWKLK